MSRLLAIVATVAIVAACECTEPTVQVKKEHSDVVFRGTIIELRKAESGSPVPYGTRGTGKVAVFHVGRVWKGDVGTTFEMPAVEETSACRGFWPPYLVVGKELLIYAERRGSDYYTSICGFHKQATDAEKDLEELGPGAEPSAGGKDRR
jgi:hypothetical protein